MATWQSSESTDPNSQAGDPQFTNTGTGDFTLDAGSPCVDNGVAPASLPTNVYATFTSRFGMSIEVDKAGNARTQGTTDIGAFEQ